MRHEYVEGEIYAMSGGTKAHNMIVGNIYIALRTHLRNSPCRVFMENIKTRIKTLKDERYYYPDIQVACGESSSDPYYENAPKLIIEVLSDSTERADRAEKFDAYRALTSLEEYVLVAQDTQQVEVYRRNNVWQGEVYSFENGNTDIYLASVAASLKLDGIYASG